MVLPAVLRRRLVSVLVLAVAVVPFVLARSGNGDRTEVCALPATAVRIGDTIACVHADEAPPGIDVTERPTTAELKERPGAAEAAYEAAAELGVPTPTELASTATGPEVQCSGDGTSGYRVQAMYVVEANKTNRYAALLPTLRTWAAGTDDVVNRSAALTGGVRHLRYVTEPGAGGTCVASILNVTVPAGSMSSFGATVSAVQALGYTNPARKYLMWTDATVLCGVASMYTSDSASQSNPNNGGYPQYARVDSGCWGLGNGTNQHSVEAHEIMHTLGGVQSSAPHSTKVGHCWDESDTMCYADGGAYAMKQICPAGNEFFFDCGNDDYFSTYPSAGSYLATHWNAADSRFLIGGGDGTGGGTLGTPTVLGATVSVNNPAVPGLATQVSVAPELPTGRSLTKIAWTSKRSDCTFGTPAALQSTVTCNATSATATTVTVTLTDSSGAVKAVSSPLTFASGSARPVTIALSAANQSTADGSTASVCTGASFPLQATVVDVASGAPVKGLTVSLKKQVGGILGTLGNLLSSVLGISGSTTSITVPTTYTATTAAGTVYAAGASPALSAVPGTCATTLTASADRTAVYYGDPVTVTGRVSRTVSGRTFGVAGLTVPVRLTTTNGTTSRVTTLGSALTTADGTWTAVVKPLANGALSADVPASTAYAARSVALGTTQVTLPETTLTATVNKTDVGYGLPVLVSGTLQRVAGSAVSGVKGTVSFLVTPPGGKAVKIGSATSTAAGTFTASVPLKVSGSLSVAYAGVAGQPAAGVVVGPVTAGTWTTQLTGAASSTSIGLGGSTTLTGTVTRTYAGSTLPAPGLKVQVWFTPGGTTTKSLLGSSITTSAGTFTAKVSPRTSGSLSLLLAAVAGYTEATGGPFPITVR